MMLFRPDDNSNKTAKKNSDPSSYYCTLVNLPAPLMHMPPKRDYFRDLLEEVCNNMKYDKCRHDSLWASATCGLCPAFMVTDTFRVPHGLMTTGTNLQRPSAIPHHDFHLVPRNFPETFLKPPLKTHHSRTGAPFLKMGLMPVDKIVSQTTKCERDARFPLGFQYACKTGQQRIFWGQQVGRNIQEA